MRRPIVITAPFATPEEIAQSYRIPKRRAKELKKMVEESLAKKGYISPGETDSTESKNGTGHATSLSVRLKVRSGSGNASRRKTARAKAKTPR